MRRKIYTLRQSVRKVEDACYNINVRGSEMPKTHLADVFSYNTNDGAPMTEEENYYSD